MRWKKDALYIGYNGFLTVVIILFVFNTTIFAHESNSFHRVNDHSCPVENTLLAPEKSHAIKPPPNNLCGISVDAGPDITICEGDNPVQLNGSTDGGVLSYSWSPAGPLNNPNLLDPTANVTETTEFILTGTGEGSDLITNGDFEQGNTGFSSEYTYTSTDLTPEGTYSILTSPEILHSNFSDCDDHSTGNGSMMVVNGAGVANVNVWCQTINTIDPNTIYEFSAWVASVHPVAPAELQFSINGVLLGDIFNASGTPCNWEEFFETWNSGSATSATICIVNQNTALSGNDFALDDITFKPVCEVSDTMVVEVLENKEETINETICEGNSIEINGHSISTEGTHSFTLEAANGCDSFLTVNLDVIQPQAVIQQPDLITCTQNIVTLDGSASTGGTDLTYNWSTSDGNFVDPPDGPLVQVDAPGSYSLTVSTTINGMTCTSPSFEIMVVADTMSPVISISPPGSLQCQPDIVTLNGQIHQPQGNVVVSWSTGDGNIVSGANGLNPQVDAPGSYTLTVVNWANGCSTSENVQVLLDPTVADAIIASADTITCRDSTVFLDGSPSSPAGLNYQWSTPDGTILTDPSAPEIETDEPGIYQLIVTAPNNCRDTTSVEVAIDTVAPEVQLSSVPPLTCNRQGDTMWIENFQELFPAQSIEWSYEPAPFDTTINIIGITDSSIHINEPGKYLALVHSKSNGCASVDSTFVDQDTTAPSFSFASIDTLDCQTDTVSVATSIQSDSLNYSWMTPSGTIVSPPVHSSIDVTTAGTYVVKVTDPDNGCSSIDSVSVSENSTPVPFELRSSEDTLTCSNPEITLSIQGIDDLTVVDIESSGPGGSPVFAGDDTTTSITSPGMYSVTVENINSECHSTESIFIANDTVQPIASAGTDDTLDCQNTTTVLDGSASQGDELAFEWMDSDQPGDVLSADSNYQTGEEGTYILTVTDRSNGCTARDTVSVVAVQEIPTIEISDPAKLTCRDTVITLDAGASDQNDDLAATWSSPDGQIAGDSTDYVIQAIKAGSYIFTLENTNNGCLSADTVQITADTVSPQALPPSDDSLTCAVMRVDLELSEISGNDISYQWTSNSGGNILGDPLGKEISVDAAGRYSVVITDGENGCQKDYSATVVQDTARPTADAGTDQILPCDPREVVLNGSESTGGTNFQWYGENGTPLPDGNAPFFTANNPGTYILEVTETRNGCRDEDSVRLTQAQSTPVSFQARPAHCELGGTFYLFDMTTNDSSTAEISSVGEIAFGDTVKNLSEGVYQLTVENKFGCRSDTSFEISSSGSIEVSLPSALTISLGDSKQLIPELSIPDSLIASIQWSPDEQLDCDSCLSPVVSPEENTQYTVRVTDVFGCIDEATIDLRVDNDISVYIPNVFSPNNDGINDIFTIYGGGHIRTINSMEIFNRWGDRVFSRENISPEGSVKEWNGRFRGNILDPGVFVYRIEVVLNDGSVRTFAGDVSLIR